MISKLNRKLSKYKRFINKYIDSMDDLIKLTPNYIICQDK
jgi:hypothetical protein